MPADVDLFDLDFSITPPTGHAQPFPLTLGPGRQPNDTRFVMISASGMHDEGAWLSMMPMDDDPPVGFSTVYAMAPGSLTEGVYSQRIPDDLGVDGSVRWFKPKGGWRHFCVAMFTARGLDPSYTPVGGHLTVTHIAGSGQATVDAVTVPGAGFLVYMLGTLGDPGSGLWPAWPSAMGVPATGGWQHVVASEKSGKDFDEFDTNPNIMVIERPVAAAGSVGQVVIPVGESGAAFCGSWLFFKPAPDVVTAGSPITVTDSCGTPVTSSANNPHTKGDPITVTDSCGIPSNPVHGYAIPDPYQLTGDPIAKTELTWSATVPDGATLTIRTSINNGLSWDLATNGGPIPRLVEGDIVTRQVLFQAELTRQTADDPLPKLHWMHPRITYTKATDELLPTFYGGVERSKTKISPIGGRSGQGSGTKVSIRALDPSRNVKLAKWYQNFVAPVGITYDELMWRMVQSRRPRQTLRSQVTTTDRTTDTSPIVFGLDKGAGDPLKDLGGVATAVGHEAFWGVLGEFITQPVPDPRRGPISWDFDQSVNPRIIEEETEINDHLIVNGWILEAASTASKNAFIAVAINEDPSHPHNVHRIGERFETRRFTHIDNPEQLQAAADALLFNSMGMATTVKVGITPHPGMLCGDVTRFASDVIAGRFLLQAYELSDDTTAQQELTLFRQTNYNP